MSKQEQKTEGAWADEAEYWITTYRHPDHGRIYYDSAMSMWSMLASTGTAVFRIRHWELSDALALKLISEPEECLQAIKDAVLALWRNVSVDFEITLRDHLRIEVIDMPPVNRLDRTMLGKFVTIGPCAVHRIEPLRNVKLKTVYKCMNCGTPTEGRKKREGSITKPLKCSACGEKELMEDDEHTILQDQRYVEVILTDEKGLVTDEGKALKYWLDIRGDQAHHFPDFGEVWQVSGIVRLAEEQEKQPINDIQTFFLYLEVNAIERVEKVEQRIEVTPELMTIRRKWVEATLKAGKDVEKELSAKIAPWIVGEDLLKKTLLLQAVSGNVQNARKRTAIHVLVMRNPGKAKTELAKFMAGATAGAYFTGTGVSAVGLVVGLENDERTKKKVAKAGVAVLYDRKCKYFDEVDKTKKGNEILPELNTPMESEFYMETKILNRRFETRGPWCLLGNFRNRYFDIDQSLAWNINLPADLMDRFDAWHIEPHTEYNKQVEEEILDSQSDGFEGGHEETEVDAELKEHIACARSITQVKFEPGVRDVFKKFYHVVKGIEAVMDTGVKFERRQFDSLYRFAIARAVLHLRDTVTVEDAERTKEHLTVIISKMGIDVRTGQIDLGALTGDEANKKQLMKAFRSVFLYLSGGSRYEDVKHEDLAEHLQKQDWVSDMYHANDLIKLAKEQAMLQETSHNRYRWIGK